MSPYTLYICIEREREKERKREKDREKMTKGFKVQQPKTRKFYTRLKIHKTGNPGCRLVSSVNSKYVDFHLQQIVKNFFQM